MQQNHYRCSFYNSKHIKTQLLEMQNVSPPLCGCPEQMLTHLIHIIIIQLNSTTRRDFDIVFATAHLNKTRIIDLLL